MLPEEPGARRQRVARGLGVRLLLRLEGVLGERGQKVELQRHVVVGDVPAQRRLEAALPVGRADFQGARLHDQPLVGRVDRLPGRRRKGGGAHEQARVLGLPSAQLFLAALCGLVQNVEQRAERGRQRGALRLCARRLVRRRAGHPVRAAARLAGGYAEGLPRDREVDGREKPPVRLRAQQPLEQQVGVVPRRQPIG